MKNFTEIKYYRDVVFWWKMFLNPDRKAFPNFIDHANNPRELRRWDRMEAQLVFRWNDQGSCYTVVVANSVPLYCCPPPSPKGDPTPLPTHRFPSTATPSFYIPDAVIRTEDDLIYRPTLPDFANEYGQVLNQRDAELLLSYLTVPYMRLPLLITFFATDDRIHKLQSPQLRGILDSVMFEPSRHLRMDSKCTPLSLCLPLFIIHLLLILISSTPPHLHALVFPPTPECT